MEVSLVSRLPDFESLPVDRHVGGRLRDLRISRDVDVSFIAKALSVPATLVEAWEQGIDRIPANQLVALTKLFFCPVATFFEGMDGLDLESPQTLQDGKGFNGPPDGQS